MAQRCQKLVWVAVVSTRDIQTFRELVQNEFGKDAVSQQIKKITNTEAAIPLHDSCISILNKLAAETENGRLFHDIHFQLKQIHDYNEKNKIQSPHSILKGKLKALLEKNGYSDVQLLSDIPKSWERHGDLVLLPSSSFCNSIWKKLGNRVWDEVASGLGCRRVAKKFKVHDDDFRTPEVQILKGDNGWVTHVDNGIKYSYDVTKCMFSMGNITEKLRIACLDCKNETVVDLYAGIGYFTLPYLIHAKADLVHACEWNPAAVEALEKNLTLNGVKDRCKVHYGDNQIVCPKGVADRVNLGLIPSSEAGWETACYALKPSTGGILHIHSNVTSKISEDASVTCANRRDVSKPDCCPQSSKVYSTSNCYISEENRGVEQSVKSKKNGGAHRDTWSCNTNYRLEWEQWTSYVAEKIEQILLQIYGKKWTVSILHLERIKSYAPHIDHIVVDVCCKPPQMMC